MSLIAYENEGRFYILYFLMVEDNGQKKVEIYELDNDKELFFVDSFNTELNNSKQWSAKFLYFFDNEYLFFDKTGYEDVTYCSKKYKLASRFMVESGKFLVGKLDSYEYLYENVFASFYQNKLNVKYSVRKNLDEFETDSFEIDNFSWNESHNVVYFDNHARELACIWRYDIITKELAKIIPEHEARAPFAFSILENEYIAYINGENIMLATPVVKDTPIQKNKQLDLHDTETIDDSREDLITDSDFFSRIIEDDYGIVLYQNRVLYRDSIPVVLAYVKYDTDDYRIVIYSEKLPELFFEFDHEYETLLTIKKTDIYPNQLHFEDNLLVIEFSNEKRFDNWIRKLYFAPILDENYNIDWKLIKDIGVLDIPDTSKKVYTKTIKDFGNVYLSKMKFDNTSDKFTLNKIQKAYKYDEKLILDFLDSIDENKTINIKSGVYNFTEINYKRILGKDKSIVVKYGELTLNGLSNINFMGEEKTLFLTDLDFGVVLKLKKCNNIKVSNIHAMHNVQYGDCKQDVVNIYSSDTISFDNCLIDGSGLEGFVINKSNHINISNSFITHCSRTALETEDSNIVIKNTSISNNELSVIFDLKNSNIIMENSTIKNVEADLYFSELDSKSNLKIINSEIELINKEATLFKGKKPVFINTKIKAIPKITKYPIQFVKTEPDSTRIDYKMDSIDVNKSLWIKNIQLVSGTIKNNKNGIHLIVKNDTGKILFKSKGQQDSWRYNPNIYKSPKNDRIIIISEIGAEESWGIFIQEFYNGQYKEIGSIDIVALNEYEESLNIIPYIKIQELDNDVLQFYFDKKVKVFDNETEKKILGENLNYKYSNGKIVMSN